MSVASEISRLQQAKADIKDAIEAKGVTVPSSAKLDTYDDYIYRINGQADNEILVTYRDVVTTTDPQTGEITTSVTYTDSSIFLPEGTTKYTKSIISDFYDEQRRVYRIKLPKTITSLGNCAFDSIDWGHNPNAKFENLHFIEGLENVTSIDGFFTFAGSSLSTINFPNLQSWGQGTNMDIFAGSSIKSVDNLGSITSIPSSTFNSCKLLRTVILPKQITIIESGAFGACESLEEINLSELTNLTTIEGGAFYGCSKLKSALPSSITTISNTAFQDCTEYDWTLYLPNLTTLGNYAFNNTKIAGISSLGLITSILEQTFRGCTSLTTVNFPNTLTTIGNYAFYGCTSLGSLVFPSSLETISAFAFNGSRPTSIDLSATEGNGLLIYNDCFRATTTSMTIKLPKDVTFSGGFQFAEQGGQTYNATTAETLDFDLDMSLSTETTIEACTFYRSKLTKITSLGSITTIAAANSSRGVFEGSTYLTEATLPSTLTSLGTRAFYGCTHLTTLTVLATTPPTFGSNALYNTTALTNIYVPAESVATYQAASGWSAFATKISAIPTP